MKKVLHNFKQMKTNHSLFKNSRLFANLQESCYQDGIHKRNQRKTNPIMSLQINLQEVPSGVLERTLNHITKRTLLAIKVACIYQTLMTGNKLSLEELTQPQRRIDYYNKLAAQLLVQLDRIPIKSQMDCLKKHGNTNRIRNETHYYSSSKFIRNKFL